jgi:hypothetical protein
MCGKNGWQGRPLGKTEAHGHSPDAAPDLLNLDAGERARLPRRRRLHDKLVRHGSSTLMKWNRLYCSLNAGEGSLFYADPGSRLLAV